MHPALSIVLFTTLSGAGYGLLFWLGLLEATGLVPEGTAFAVIAGLLALGAIVAGLVCSTFHLRHPERAWRALSQWRSSWLSREGLLSLATFVPALVFLGGWLVGGASPAVDVAGLLTALFALATVACTAMIYRSLWTVPAWHNGWTLPGFLLLALASGGLLLCAAATLAAGTLAVMLLVMAMAAVAAAALVKLGAWRAVAGARPQSSAAGALGLSGRARQVRPVQPPSTSETYLQKEMGFHIARKHADKLRRIAGLAGIVLPFVCLVAAAALGGAVAVIAALLAAGSGLAGVLIERWLFFAEARHKVTLYDGADAV